MAKKIALFEKQQDVITAIEELEGAGFTPGEMLILTKDWEHSRRIESETDTHVEEMRELEETGARGGELDDFGLAIVPSYGYPVIAGGYGLSTFEHSPGIGGGGYSGAAPFDFIDNAQTRAYRSLGLDSKESKLCSEAVRGGAIAFIVETNESKSLLDKDGGPDLSKLGIAEAAFRRNGAYQIADGS
ncbi:general stress protein [Paenibacillus paeoniae]|uniref:Uncharacterized protein n=1 Tax=Paenibacillus paeoniae TaxID=2292705 RepID=A0A371P6D0_9BACL|nr:general stress protein [Paenibacillus paeoniae]REK71452.1 hypothetical protein DX130_20830 [Paenibacillus paeoniae]